MDDNYHDICEKLKRGGLRKAFLVMGYTVGGEFKTLKEAKEYVEECRREGLEGLEIYACLRPKEDEDGLPN